jgi:ABC-type polysaccharide/polyol phosphate transport system ATPase subunit
MQRVIVNNISKRFRIGFRKDQGTLARFISFFSGVESKRIIWALKDVSFNVRAGEVVGIIGGNGSGKSTLLRVIAGIYNKDSGEVKIDGKIVSLINLNIGLKERLPMTDNIYVCCSLFSLPRKEIKKRFDSIVEFSGLNDFVSTKIYQFSGGMKQRLVFSIAAHCDADILLLDEVFEVGDEEFRTKSANKVKELTKDGTSVILVSHEMWMVEKYCDRVIWLDKGTVVKEGKVEDVTGEYKRDSLK